MEVHKQQRMKQKIIRLERKVWKSSSPTWCPRLVHWGQVAQTTQFSFKYTPLQQFHSLFGQHLFQCFTTFAVKFVFALVLSLSTLKTNLTMPSHPFSSILVGGNNEISPKLSFLQYDQTNFFQLFLVHHMLQSRHHLGPPQG